MTIIKSEILADSFALETGYRATTFLCEYPAFFHQDIMTHRVVAKSAISTRAIPSRVLRKRVREEMASPTFWGLNQAGMQANEQLTGFNLWAAKKLWYASGVTAVAFSWLLEKTKLAKQNANMGLWPYMHFRTIMTASDWANFFHLRDHKDARPELKDLAHGMNINRERSRPVELNYGDWHLPFVDAIDKKNYPNIEDQKTISSARCARTSYDKHGIGEGDARSDLKSDNKLKNKLLTSEIVHASPFEHQLTPDRNNVPYYRISPNGALMTRLSWERPELHGNTVGFIQNRKLIPNESTSDYEYLQFKDGKMAPRTSNLWLNLWGETTQSKLLLRAIQENNLNV